VELLAALHDRAHYRGEHGTDDTAAADRAGDLSNVQTAATATAEEAAQESAAQSAANRSGDAVSSGAEVVFGAGDVTADEPTDDTQYPFHLILSLMVTVQLNSVFPIG
jgi:hypothetical protein